MKLLDIINEEFDEVNLDFNPIKFANYVVNTGIRYPDIAIAQSLLETGHFKSKIFKENNNAFGMRLAKKRQTTAKGEKSGHAYYSNWRDSVKDYKLWQENRGFDKIDRSLYFTKLDKIYCPPPDCGSNQYSNHVKSLLSKSQDLINKCYAKPKTRTFKKK